MTGKALIIVDVQNDFCEGGSMGVAGGKEASRKIFEHLKNSSYDLVVATRDWHDPNTDNGGHFGETPDFVDTWPKHCVQSTFGAQYEDSLGLSKIDTHIVKGMNTPAYSGFEGFVYSSNQASAETLTDVLLRNNIQQLEIVGIATDYCVKATAVDGAKAGFDVTVLAEMTASIADDMTATFKVLEDAGVAVVGHPPIPATRQYF